MITFITGGARSGKSSYAQKQALALSSSPVYIATAKVWDDEFRERVNKHQSERGSEWTSIETYKNIAALFIKNKTVVIDCVTLWLTNLFIDHKNDIDACLNELRSEIEQIAKLDATFFIISNEIGMGIHAETAIGRKFTDLQGWANQYIASIADEVIFMISGIPMIIKKDHSIEKE